MQIEPIDAMPDKLPRAKNKRQAISCIMQPLLFSWYYLLILTPELHFFMKLLLYRLQHQILFLIAHPLKTVKKKKKKKNWVHHCD